MNTHCRIPWSACAVALGTWLSCGTAQAGSTLDNGLLGHWTFDDPASLGQDSASTNNGAVHGGAYAFASSRVGAGALSLNGVDGYVEVADNEGIRFTASQSFTLSAWVYPAKFPYSWRGVVTKSRNQSPWYGIWINGNNQWFFGGPQNLTGSDLPMDGNGELVRSWFHVTAVQDGAQGTSTFYVDGVPVVSGASADVNGAGPLWIGGAVSVSEYFNGLIDDVRLYNRVLTDEEIGELVNVAVPTPTQPLALLAEPQDVSVFPNDQVNLNAQANHDGLTYQWYKDNSPFGDAGQTVTGVATPPNLGLMSQADNGSKYYVVFTDQNNQSITSRVATITVEAATGINAGLLGHWTFDDPTNLGKDMASTNNAVAMGGAYSFGSSRVGAGALSVDGIQGHLEIADTPEMRFAANQTFTLSAWVYPANLPGSWKGIVTKSRNQSPWYGIWINDQNQWVFGENQNLVGQNLPVDENNQLIPQWHLITVMQDGSQGASMIYVDGLLMAAGQSANVNGSGPLWIGGAASVSEYFNGLIDDVRLYKRVLTEAEITELYNAAMPSTHLPVAILTQPKDVRTIPGRPVTFTATANQFNLTYQWYKGNTPIGSPVAAGFGAGVASATLTIDAATLADDGSTYHVVFTGSNDSVTSEVVHLTVKEAVDGLVARYTFDDPANLGADSAVGLNPGTPVGGATFSSASRVGAGALEVDGAGGHIAVADVPYLRFAGTDSFTVSTWFKAQPKTSWGGIVTKGRSTSPWYGIWRDPDGPRLFSGTAETWPPTEPVLPDGDWHHAAIVQDGAAGTYALYVDGVNQNVPFAIPATTGAGDLWIGGADNGEYFQGLIDDVRIYNRALSSSEVNALMVVAPTPTLAIKNTSGSLTITFTGALEATDALSGTWTNVTGATSPLVITNPKGNAFYRAKQQ